MHIESYSFGKIVINGRAYTSDVIIYPDRIDSSWWRKEGHCLQKEDVSGIVGAKPDILIIGTGYSGIMQVPEQTTVFLESYGMKVFIERTGKAVDLFNNIQDEKKTVGAFHLTC